MPTVKKGIIDHVKAALEGIRHGNGRPFITLSYAQSIDGSISMKPGTTLQLSNEDSLILTHQMRAAHDGIMVGINTILVDDPKLTVRLVDGRSPVPIIVDSNLRIPMDAHVITQRSSRLLIATTEKANREKALQLREMGIEVLTLPQTEYGQVSLPALLDGLRDQKIRTVMVEGGAKIITSFLATGLANQLVITICPVFVGGLRSIDESVQQNIAPLPRFNNVHTELLSEDLILRGDLLAP